MHFIFADDSRQAKPTRLGMGPLVPIGGVHVRDTAAGPLERELQRLCVDAGFPPGEEFKWSPGPEMWMHGNLHSPARETFLRGALTMAGLYGATATVVVADARCRHANKTSTSCEHDVTTMFLERAENALRAAGTTGVVVIDRPGGNRKTGQRFLAACVNTVTTGTAYVLPQRITSVELAWSTYARNYPRLLQLADVVTGCTLARVAGSTWAPPTFEAIRPLLRSDGRRIGGVGLKLHPDVKYANLYFWLVGDDTWWKGTTGVDLPCRGPLYFSDPEDGTAARPANSAA